MQNKQLAPVILFVYNRPEHTKKVLEALSQNYLANQSDLYIFCDGPKTENAVQKNDAVKKVILEEEKKRRFSSVHITVSEVNKGLAKSIISGVTTILGKYGCCIVLEDDHITSKYFLTYMNQALDFYKAKQDIWSISGFTYPLNSLKNYSHDVYLSYRACSHGWGTWIDRWNLVDWNVSDFAHLQKSFLKRWRFNRGGNDLYRMLRHQVRGERDSWAIRFCYSQSKNEMYTVYPKVSLIKNIGFDGTGTHCQEDQSIEYLNFYMDIESLQLEDIQLDNKVVKEFKAQYKVSIWEAICWVLNKISKKLKGK